MKQSSDESKPSWSWFLGLFLIGMLMKCSFYFAIRWSGEIPLSSSIKVVLEVLLVFSVRKGLTPLGPQAFCLSKIFHFLIFCSQWATNYVSFCFGTNTCKFGDTGVPMVLKGSNSSIVGWKCSRLIYLKIC